MKRRYKLVDVFTSKPTKGNPLAVVLDAEGLDEEAMCGFARWVNLSETAFMTAPSLPGADYRVRIFTPGGELPFAGHPTLGSCHAWLEAGGRPAGDDVVQECGVGAVRVRRSGERLAFAAPPLRSEEVEAGTLDKVLAALGLPPGKLRAARWLDNGPRWLGLLVAEAADVLALEPDHAALKGLAKVGVVGPYPAGAECAFEVRGFAASIGVNEDPVTGSLNASLAEWLMAEGAAPVRYVAAQGSRLGRAGRVHVERLGKDLWIGGNAVTCVDGELSFP